MTKNKEKAVTYSDEMQKRIMKGVEVQRSSGNVFADLGLPNAEKLKIQTGLVIEISQW